MGEKEIMAVYGTEKEYLGWGLPSLHPQHSLFLLRNDLTKRKHPLPPRVEMMQWGRYSTILIRYQIFLGVVQRVVDFRATGQCMLMLGTWFLMSKHAGLPVAHFPVVD